VADDEQEEMTNLPMFLSRDAFIRMCTQVAAIDAKMGLLRDLQRDYRKLDERVKNIEMALAGGPDPELTRRVAAIESSLSTTGAKQSVWALIGGRAFNIVVAILTSGVVIGTLLEVWRK